MSTVIEDGNKAVGNLISIFSLSNLWEMLRCHVMVFTVCWQKCNFPKPILSCQCRHGDSPPNLRQQGVYDVFGRLCRMMCEYLCLSQKADKLQVLR